MIIDTNKPLECVHIDTCLPDYWQGHHLPHVSITVWHGMSLKVIKELLIDEIKLGCVGGNDVALIDSEAFYKKAIAAIRKLKPAQKGRRRFFLELDKSTATDEDCSVYAYFIFCNEE